MASTTISPKDVSELRARHEAEVRLRLGGKLVLLNRRVVAGKHDAAVPFREVCRVVQVCSERANAGCAPGGKRRRKVEERTMHVQQERSFANGANPRPLGEPAVRRIVGVAALG